MLTYIEIKLRKWIVKFLQIIDHFCNQLPSSSLKTNIIKWVNNIKKKVILPLYDDYTFLSYVKRKKIGLEKQYMSINTLAIRGSNSDYGFYSSLWKGSFNLGLTSTDLYTTYKLYENYRDNLKNLKYVIFFINIPSPGYSLIHTIERYRAVTYKYFFNIPYLNDDYINTKYEKWILNKCGRIRINEVEPDYYGYDKKLYYGTNIKTQERVRTHIRENRREPNQLIWLKRLNALIQSDGRRLIILIPPFRSDYKNALPNEAELFKKFYELELKGVEYLNFYNSTLFSEDDFGDVDHLNEKGAIKLTTELKKIFENRNWI